MARAGDVEVGERVVARAGERRAGLRRVASGDVDEVLRGERERAGDAARADRVAFLAAGLARGLAGDAERVEALEDDFEESVLFLAFLVAGALRGLAATFLLEADLRLLDEPRDDLELERARREAEARPREGATSAASSRALAVASATSLP